jgi:dynein heavy chain
MPHGVFNVRENIRRELDKKTKDMWFMFTEEVNRVKRLLAMKKPDLSNMPKYAGAAHWARLLKRRVERPMEDLEMASVFLSKTGSGEEAKASYNNLIQALEDFVRQTFAEWSASVAKESIASRLDQPLMIRSTLQPELLDVNFDPVLLKLFEEIHHWERLMFEIPHYAAEV